MNFDQIVVKESPGLCRCCLSEGCYKDLGSEYTWMNETEIYADMLLECFDISISQHNEGPNGPNRLICEVCITRLRDACNFKKQVLDSEKKFVDMVGRGEFKSKVLVFESDMKLEPNAENFEETEVEYLEESMDYEDDDKFLSEIAAEAATSADIIEAPPAKAKRGRPKRTTTVIKQEKKVKVPKLEEKPRSSKTATKGINSEDMMPDDRLSKNQKRYEMGKLLTYLLQCSTMMPFRWYGNKYMCFYCCCSFVDSCQLKTHTRQEHEGAYLKNRLDIYLKGEPTTIKLDVSAISCRICPKPINDLEDFLKHSQKYHDFKYDLKLANCLLAFKLSDEGMRCIECGEDFRFFGPLLAHVNKYHSKINTHLCDICGQGFSGKATVITHIRHAHSVLKCRYDDCDKSFPNIYYFRRHIEKEHCATMLKCPKCPEVLPSRYLKKRHLAMVHDVKSVQFRCDQCPKIFTLMSRLVSHKQRLHLKERTVTCGVCGFKVFNKELLKRHMVKHDGSRPYECDVCKKTFQRKKTLDYHMRIHTNDRRHACKECGATFIQPTSLRLHVKVHHSSTNDSDM